jgi:alanyl-tRNA synthetase
VLDEEDAIVHVLASPLRGTAVKGEISWTRRYDHMQQHTGQHLLSAVFAQLFDIPTLSFRMGDDTSTIELGSKEITRQQMDTVTMRATELARANARIAISYEDAAEAQGLRKVSQRAGVLRIIEIPGIDRSACGGTHVASLAEVLPLQIRDMDKVRGNVRISFVCGNRAITRAQRDFQILSGVAKSLATSIENLEAQVAAIRENLAEAEKQRQRLESEAAVRAGLDLYAGSTPGEDGMRRRIAAEVRIDENARNRAKAFASQARAVILLHSADGLLLACSTDSGVNAGVMVKQALAKVGARGGGSATLAQGSLPDRAVVEDLARLLGFAMTE